MCCFYVWFLSQHVFKDHPHWLWSNRNSWSPGPPFTDNSRWLGGMPVMTARGHCGSGKCSFHSSVANYRGLWGPYFSERQLLKATYSCLLNLLPPSGVSVSASSRAITECCTKKAPNVCMWNGWTLVMWYSQWRQGPGFRWKMHSLGLYSWSQSHSKRWVPIHCSCTPGHSELPF